jgi:4-carboxymuconolactone decarboxylase
MRLEKLSYERLSLEQKKIWDEVVAGPRKKMHGPFFAWLHSPELLSRGQNLGLYARFHSSLQPRLSELCILIMSAQWECAGEWIDHYPIAREHGIDAEALENLRLGRPARFKHADEVALYEFARELLDMHEVTNATYDKARSVLGERGLLDVVAVLGYYSMIAMTMKAFAMLPEPNVLNPFG